MKLMRFNRPENWGWPTVDQLSNLREEINRLFQSPFEGRESEIFNTWSPALDLYEDKDNLVVKAELPGMERKDITLNLEKNVLTLKGERRFEKEAKDENYHRIERSYGSFHRSIALPAQVDDQKVDASFKNGVLTVVLPKVAPGTTGKKIEVKKAT